MSPAPPSILYPHWTRPALLGPERTCRVVLDAQPDEAPRLNLAGSASHYGYNADLNCFGKAMANAMDSYINDNRHRLEQDKPARAATA